VILTNGWDRHSREKAAQQFGLDWDDFQERHELVVSDFDTGRLGLEAYLDRTVFAEPRPFSRESFKSFMRNQSQPYPDALAFLAEVAGSGKYVIAALNNESKELNDYRIARFDLTDYFSLFFSSCYLGVRKPDEKLYRIALEVTQRKPEECLFVDDRAVNVEVARRIGMRAIHYRDVDQLRRALNP
jgi:putative hydrolase of the HAD superfamily